MKGLAVFSCLAALFPAMAFAQDTGFYVDGGYTFIGIDDDDLSADVDLGAITGRGGLKVTEYLGVEAEAGFGVSDEEFSDGVTTASVSLNYLLGGYGVASYPISDKVSVFARAGVAFAELEAEVSGGGVSASDSEGEVGYGLGAGAKVNVTPRIYLRGDYTRYDIEELEANAFTIGVGGTF